ncbi:MAG TPA: 4Fe-4S dicluster domain-containing protein [Candidatus Lokiarchaeia archaeon]|nr:4Fe-4S dicluster domain-containing protein [Candidatus Lokiarchaeia archaeon]
MDLYEQLRRHFDSGPIPFPTTETAIEIDLLKDFFSEEDCRVLLALGWMRVPAEKIHKRLKKARVPEGEFTLDQVKKKLDELYLNGTINMKIQKGVRRFCLDPVVIGWYEHKIDFLTPAQVRMFNEYAGYGFAELWGGDGVGNGTPPQMRVIVHPKAIEANAIETEEAGPLTIAINESITYKPAVSSYDDVRTLLAKQSDDALFVVVNCICKQSKDLIDEPCKKTDDRKHCLSIGEGSQKYLDRGQGTRITKKEAQDLLEWQIQQGLVLQCGNYTDELREVCACCGCCCGVLTNAKKLARPADVFHVSYQSCIDTASCKKCGLCMARCQMDAVEKVNSGKNAMYRVNLDRCIGCGVCVEGCKYGAIKLVKKKTTAPPKDKDAFVMQRIKYRFGRIGLLKFLVKAALGMKV